MNDRLNNLLKQLDDQKNESIFNICVNQIIKLYALNPRFGSTIMKKIISLMMSKHTFQRQLAAALFEGLVDPIHDQIEEALKDESAYEQLTSVVVALSYTELLKEKSGELDKIIESSMKDMELDKMMMFVRDPQNCLYSKHEKAYAQSKKNTTQVVDEGMIMHQLGGTLDLKSIRDSDDPEEYIQSYIENARGKKSGKKGPIKKGAAVQNTKNGADDEEDEFMKDEIKDEITKKLKIQEDGTPVPDGRKQRRVSSILIIILDVARVLLFNQNWELRHGASMIIRAAARKAKSFYYFSHYDAIADFKDPAFSTNLKNTIQTEVSSGIHDLLMDVIIRNLLILALDRFSDFVGDKSSIIVRDISAQVIAESLSYLKDKEITQKMISYFKELLQRDIKQGWEPKHGVIYLMYRLIEKMPTLTKTFFNKFAETIHSKINEHEEILEVSCGFFQQALANEPDLFSSKILMLFCKSYLEAGEKLEDISYSVSPLSRLLGDFFKIMLSRPDMAVDGLGSQSIRIIMTKFFFQPVRVDLFYMLSNWLLLQSKTFSTSQGFTHISLLMKMYLIGIYTEEDKTRKEELVKNLKACQKTFNEAAQLHLVKIIAEICESCTIKEYLQVDEDSDMTEMIKSSKNWSDTSEEVLCSIKVFASIGEVLWTTIGQISPAKRPEAFKLLTNLKNTPQKEINSMQLVFYLVTVLKVSEGSAVVPPEIQGLAQLPTPEQALDYTPQQLWTKQISHMLCKSLDSLGQIVTDYLGGLEHEEIRETMFKVLMLLDAKKNLRWPEILTGLEASKDNLLELRKVLHQLAMSSKIPYTVYKLQVEFLDTRVIKSMKDALETLNQVGLYIKGTAASIITARDVAAKRKEKNLNKIIKPLLALFKIKDELDDTWGIIFAQGLFNICICFESDTSHPNNKIIQSVLSVCAEKDEQLAEFLQTTPESEQKQNKTSVEMSPIKPLLYFSLLIKRYAASSFSKYPTLSGIYESAKLIRLFLPIIFEHCPASLSLSFFEDHIKKIQDTKEFKSCYIILFILVNRSLQNHQLVDEDLARLLNSLLLHMHEAISQASMTGLETMLQLLREFEKEMIPFSKIFIKRTLKLINTDLAYEQKKLVYELFSRILTLSYVQDSDVQPKDLNELMLGKWMRGNSFLMEFRSNKLYMVDIPDIKSVQLRPYQLEGIAWVNFLFKYNLSGALCDDMGLGKTIQSLITVLIFEQKNPGSRSLIVCPNGLVKHWEMEAKKHYQGYNLKVSVIERGFTGNWKSYADTNLFITSDTMITKNSNLFEKEQFLVGVLDEAHLIKNEKSKLSKSIKTLSIRHKLALTGTPIQNNLLELWSIFDFLMPNYLGTREEFKKNFSRLFCLNLVNIDITKMDLTDDQTKDLQLLHQRVLPFILRRLKGQVLKDLPEKIIQDYECEMTDLQKKIYKVFEDSDLDQIEKALNIMEKAETAKPTTGPAAPEIAAPKKRIPLLQALNCMRKICNHPGLVDPKYCIGLTSEEQKELKQFDSSAKLRGLRTLFEQLGFDPEEDNYENGNKVLIFTRFIDTLGLLEGFFKHTFPKIKTCKIDGSMDTTIRYNVIDKFINEFDIKIMFLTTKVGGLGLNLSCANIVVMFDHDFNPTNDLQAMERAHRLGQKKVVNVYRFILKDTLEEKIMGIQKFKLSMANTVINMENSSINNIKDSKLVTLLDNLATHQSKQAASKIEKEEDKLNPDKKKEFAGAYSKVIENSDLKEIWDENEYDREYR